MKKCILALCILGMLLVGCGKTESPDQWPTKKIDIQVAYTAGGTADTANRQLAAIMSDTLGTTFNITNVTGGSGSIAGQQVLTSDHNGYTWLGDVAHTVSGWRTLDYVDMGWEDFYGFYAATSPYVLFVSGNSPYETAQDLFYAMEKEPNMKWGNAGLGSINQLTGQLMLDTLGLSGKTVPYDGGRAAAVKVVAGEVEWSWCGLSDIMDLAISGDIRILGVCAPEELEISCVSGAYQAPSLMEKYPQLSSLENLLYWGFRVPRNTPPETVSKIRDAFEQAVASEQWLSFCQSKGLDPACVTGEESDEMCARLESIYAWGLYDIGMAAKAPSQFQIPRIQEFSYPANQRAEAAQAWPE